MTPRRIVRRLVRRLVRRGRALFARRRLERELDDEVRFHLEMEEAELRRRGLDPAAARREARVGFGAEERFREECRDARGVRPLEDLVRDLRLGLRTLGRRPLFTAVMLATLGLGVGGSAAIFGAVDGILLTPLPYPRAERVMTVWQRDLGDGERQEVAPANFLDWRRRSRSFDRLAALEPFGLDWQSPEGPIYLHTWLASEGFFDLLGTRPLLGRAFRDDEHAPGRGDVVVLGYELWRRRFAGDPGIVGRVLTLDRRPHTVVGVMPEGFGIPGDGALWAPKVWEGWERTNRGSAFYTVFGRLAAGATPQSARAEMDAVAGRLAREYPETNADTGVELVPLPEQIVGGVRRTLLLLLGAVGLVFAIVGANVAGLQLARAAGRRREFELRGALGAGRGRLVRQLLAESLLLAAGGAGLGFVLARGLLGVVRRLAPADLPRLAELRADGEVLAFAVAVALLAALAAGLVPALLAARVRGRLLGGGRTATAGRSITRVQGALTVAQIGISLVLLVAAGLLLRSFVSLLTVDRGFRTEGVAVVTVQSWSHYPDPPDRVAFVRAATERLAALPGVRAAGMTSSVPLMESIGAELRPLAVEGRTAPGEELPMVHFSVVTPGLFEALGVPLRRGRLFDRRDDAGAPAVALVNEALVRRFWPDRDPLGRRITIATGGPPVTREVVGVVGDVRRYALHETARPGVFVPHAQAPTGANALVVWTAGDPAEALDAARRAIGQLHPGLPIYSERTMAELVGGSVRDRRFLLALLGAFAAIALALAAAGLFGLMSYLVAERRREIGVRMAFGAHRAAVVAMVVGRGGKLAAIGIAVGLAGAAAVTRLLAGALYAVTPLDPVAFGAGAGLLLATALLACWLPARRAAATDPVDVLRAE